MTLSEQLRDATRSLHSTAERAGLMPDLLRGALPLPRYVGLMRQLQAIYGALETALQRPGAPRFDPLLARTTALDADMAYLDALLPAGRVLTVPPVGAVARDYAAHLLCLAPGMLAAHAYVRYLGDLAGGQVLARIVGRAYGLTDAGLQFYRFGAEPAQLSQGLRAVLDSLPSTQHAAIVAEAQSAFGRHVALFETLGVP